MSDREPWEDRDDSDATEEQERENERVDDEYRSTHEA